jgi:hypothetical protein
MGEWLASYCDRDSELHELNKAQWLFPEEKAIGRDEPLT